MPNPDTLTLLGLGFTIFFGSLRLHPSNKSAWLLIVLGGIVIATGCVKALFELGESHPVIKLLIAGSATSLGIMAYFLAWESYLSAHIKDYIVLWERNGKNWDNSDGKEMPLCLKRTIQNGEDVPYVLRLSKDNGPAKFTPVIQSLYDSLEKDAQISITFEGSGLRFDDTQIKIKEEWRPVDSDATNGQRYWGIIDTPIYYGESKVGPDGVLQVYFPPGTHKVSYKLDGESKKGCAFSSSGHFLVEIY